jgi:hypothetical protein
MKRIILFTALLSAIIVYCFYKYNIDNTDLKNFKDLLNATISIGSIGVGFLAAAVTLLPAQQNNSFLQALRTIGGYNKLLDALLVGIAVLFFTCFLSVLGLFLNLETDSNFAQIFFYTWLFSFIITMSNVIYVIGVFLYYLRSASNTL